MWWLLLPPAVYIGKKIYDAVTEDDSPSSSSNPSSMLYNQKDKRTKVRTATVKKLLSEHRDRINAQLSDMVEQAPTDVGEVAVNLTTYEVRFTDLDKAISSLNMANSIIFGKDLADNRAAPLLQPITLKSKSSLVREIVEKADSEYGALAGIDSYNYYIEDQDPFLDALRKKMG